MTASEILADNLRRLMQGQESLDWAGDVVTSYHVDQALDGAHMVLVNDLQSIASAAGVEPWQQLAPLLGKGAWVDRSFAPHLPSLVLVTTPPAGIAARDVGSVVCASGVWTSYVERGNEFTDHPTEAEARAAVEAALFEGVANADQA